MSRTPHPAIGPHPPRSGIQDCGPGSGEGARSRRPAPRMAGMRAWRPPCGCGNPTGTRGEARRGEGPPQPWTAQPLRAARGAPGLVQLWSAAKTRAPVSSMSRGGKRLPAVPRRTTPRGETSGTRPRWRTPGETPTLNESSHRPSTGGTFRLDIPTSGTTQNLPTRAGWRPPEGRRDGRQVYTARLSLLRGDSESQLLRVSQMKGSFQGASCIILSAFMLLYFFQTIFALP